MTVRHLDCRVPDWLESFIERQLGPPELVNLANLRLAAIDQLYEGELLIMPMDDGRASLAWQAERNRLRGMVWSHGETGWTLDDAVPVTAPVKKRKPMKAKGLKRI